MTPGAQVALVTLAANLELWTSEETVQVWAYDPLVAGGNAVDDVSLVLTIAGEGDERVIGQLNALSEEELWCWAFCSERFERRCDMEFSPTDLPVCGRREWGGALDSNQEGLMTGRLELGSESPIRSAAWRIADEFRLLDAGVFSRSSALDAGEMGQKSKRWWDGSTWYAAGVAAHVAENMKWWSLSLEEKGRARELERSAGDDVAARERFLAEFPFDPAFLEGSPKGLPATNGQIESLGDVLSRVRRRELAVAYLEGLGALSCVGDERSHVLNVLAEEAADKAVAADADEWRSFVKAPRAALW